MGIIDRLRQWAEARRYKKRRAGVLAECGCLAFCPRCGDILNDQAEWVEDQRDDGRGTYMCSCGWMSVWHFAIAPGPVLLAGKYEGVA